MSKLDTALELAKKPKYLSILNLEANENSWQEKTRQILNWIGIDVSDTQQN